MGNPKTQNTLEDIKSNGYYYIADWLKLPDFSVTGQNGKVIKV